MVPNRGEVLAAATGLTLLLCSPSAHALWEDEQGALYFGGSFRSTSAVMRYYDSPLFGGSATGQGNNRADGLNYSALRLTADGSPADWFSYELHVVQDVSMATSPGASGGFGFSDVAPSRYRLLRGSDTWLDEGDVDATLQLDRANLTYRLDLFDVTVGRQAITFGKAHFWNPLDVFLPFDSREFDREYKRGVDALRADIPLGDMSGLNFVAALGRRDGERVLDRTWYGSALMARAYTNVADWDVAAQGGKIYGGYQAGGGFTGVIGPIEVRAEAAYFFESDEPQEPVPVGDHATAVIGVGRLFDSSLNLQAEYLYNGAGDDDDLFTAFRRVLAGRALQMSEHVAGGLVSYDLLPLLNGSVAAIVSLSDGSGVVQPGLSYSISDESDVLFGALLAFGRRPRPTSLTDPGLRSEFGTYPDFYYLQYRFYF